MKKVTITIDDRIWEWWKKNTWINLSQLAERELKRLKSLEERVLGTCPKCGNRQEATLWDSINVRLNPELREKLLKHEINIFKCGSCDTVAFIGHPFLYNDMRRNYCVQYFPPELLKDESFLRQYSRDGRLKM